MRFERSRSKTGGRKRGTPNRVSAQWREWVDTAVSLAGQYVEPGLRDEFQRLGITLPTTTPAPVACLLRQALDEPSTFTRAILARQLSAAIAGDGGAPSIRIAVVTGTDPALGEPGVLGRRSLDGQHVSWSGPECTDAP